MEECVTINLKIVEEVAVTIIFLTDDKLNIME